MFVVIFRELVSQQALPGAATFPSNHSKEYSHDRNKIRRLQVHLCRSTRAETAQRSSREGYSMEEMGAVSQRAAVGDGARGLQPRWQCLGLLLARPGAFAGLSLGRGRTGRILRRQAAALLCAVALEWPRPHTQGAAVWAYQQRREPRRGRQGILLLHRQHAD